MFLKAGVSLVSISSQIYLLLLFLLEGVTCAEFSELGKLLLPLHFAVIQWANSVDLDQLSHPCHPIMIYTVCLN
jgi:hypothetical protein